MQYHVILGISHQCVYSHFSQDDLHDIEMEALSERRKHHAIGSMRVDKALEDSAIAGSPAAIKLFKQTVEGWSEKVDVGASGTIEIKINKPPS